MNNNPFVNKIGRKYFARTVAIEGVRPETWLKVPRWWIEGLNPPNDRGKRRVKKGRFHAA